ncbi:hypothetical protein BX666DRAFT_1992337 [Dichotomocladium elegans]|nr:hypothetical protein BX666DRAFT_1992337 [Dichotomocladium elegans]
MASMRGALTRSNAMIVGTLVLVLGSVFYLKYMSASSKEAKQRSIPEKKRTSAEEERNKESETVSEDTTSAAATTTATATTTTTTITATTTSFEPIVLTGPPQEHEPCASEALEELWSVEKIEASDDETVVTEPIATTQKEFVFTKSVQNAQPTVVKAPKAADKAELVKEQEVKTCETFNAVGQAAYNTEPAKKTIKDALTASSAEKKDTKEQPKQQQQQQQIKDDVLVEKKNIVENKPVQEEPKLPSQDIPSPTRREDVKQRHVVTETLFKEKTITAPVEKESEIQPQRIVVLTEEHDIHKHQIMIEETVEEKNPVTLDRSTENEHEEHVQFVMVLTEDQDLKKQQQQYLVESEVVKDEQTSADAEPVKERSEPRLQTSPPASEEAAVKQQELTGAIVTEGKHVDTHVEPTEQEPEAPTPTSVATAETVTEEKEQYQAECEAPEQDQVPTNAKPVVKETLEMETESAIMTTAAAEEEIKQQQQSETESSTFDESVFGGASEETILQHDDDSSIIPPATSSSTTSLCSSASSKHLSDKQYPNTSPSMILQTPANLNHPKPTSYWEQTRIEPMPQATVGWPLLSAQEFKPQYQSNVNLERRSFYTADPEHAIGGQLANAVRKKNKRAMRKRMTREELIQDQRQSHNASFKSRCKFWPNCSNRNCKYKHPVKECRVGDDCQFGDRCMFIHPSDIAG